MHVASGKIRVQRELYDEFVRQSITASEICRSKPGCVVYQYSASLEEPYCLDFFQVWETEADSVAHYYSEEHVDRLTRGVNRGIISVDGTTFEATVKETVRFPGGLPEMETSEGS